MIGRKHLKHGIAASVLALTSCQAPPYASYVLVNHTGSVVRFADCQRTPHAIQPNGELVLVDRKTWGIYAKCMFKEGLTLSTDKGDRWYYPPTSLQKNPSFRFVYGDLAYRHVSREDEQRPVYHLRIDPAGSISLGRYRAASSEPDAPFAKRHIDFPDQQPRGFPIKPMPEDVK